MGKPLSPYGAVSRRQREAFHTKIRVTRCVASVALLVGFGKADTLLENEPAGRLSIKGSPRSRLTESADAAGNYDANKSITNIGVLAPVRRVKKLCVR